MQNPIKQIYVFNKKAGLLDKPYSDFLESAFQIEEALEGCNTLEYLSSLLDGSVEVFIDNPGYTPKELSRAIVSAAYSDDLGTISDVDRLDKACDAVVYAVGSMAKLGLDPQQITKALNIVMTANMKKLENKSTDSLGKLNKPASFVGPEAELQKLLDTIKKV